MQQPEQSKHRRHERQRTRLAHLKRAPLEQKTYPTCIRQPLSQSVISPVAPRAIITDLERSAASVYEKHLARARVHWKHSTDGDESWKSARRAEAFRHMNLASNELRDAQVRAKVRIPLNVTADSGAT
jgi:hypothetical protein